MPRIVSTPTILGGKQRISGTRISVDIVYTYLKDNNLKQLKEDYPHLTDDRIETALRHIQRLAKKGRTSLGPEAD